MEEETGKEKDLAHFPNLVHTKDDSIDRIAQRYRIDSKRKAGQRAVVLYVPMPGQEHLGSHATPSEPNGKWLDFATATRLKK